MKGPDVTLPTLRITVLVFGVLALLSVGSLLAQDFETIKVHREGVQLAKLQELLRYAGADSGVGAVHVGSGLPACSRTTYSAYQSGPPAVSCLPIRFSCSPCAAAARRSAAASSPVEVNVVTSASTRPGNRAVSYACRSWSATGSLRMRFPLAA